MTTEPKMYTENFVTAECTFDNPYHFADNKANLFDYDPSTYIETIGANDDDKTMNWDIYFYEGTTATPRTIDTILFTGINLKRLGVNRIYNGEMFSFSDYQTIAATSATFSVATAVLADRLRINIVSTQVADQEKRIGDLYAMQTLLDWGQDLTDYDVTYRQKAKELTLGDGSIRQIITRASLNRIEKYEGKWVLENATQALHDSLKTIKESGAPFLWQPESISRPSEIYRCEWSTPWHAKYSGKSKAGGYTITGTFKEL